MSSNVTAPDMDDSLFTWTETVLGLCAITALVNVFFLCASGNLITWNKQKELQCRPQCGLTVFPMFGAMLINALQQVDSQIKGKRIKKILVKAAKLSTFLAKLVLNVTELRKCTFCKSVYAPRRQFAVRIRALLNEAEEPVRDRATDAVAEFGADSAIAVRLTDLSGSVEAVCDAAHQAARERLAETHGEKINVADIVVRMAITAIRVPRLGNTLGLFAANALSEKLAAKLGNAVAGTVTAGTNLQVTVANVWARLRKRILGDERLAKLLRTLVNNLIDADALRPVNTLWLRAIVISGAWILVVLAGATIFPAVIETSRYSDSFASLRVEFSNGYRIGMMILVGLAVLFQLVLVRTFLQWKAKRIAHELVESIERTLLSLLSDEEVLAFIRFAADQMVEILIEELSGTGADDPPSPDSKGGGAGGGGGGAGASRGGAGEGGGSERGLFSGMIAGGLRNAYSEWGGTDMLMKILGETARSKVRPSIVLAFNTPLKRTESKADALKAAVQKESFSAEDLQDDAAESDKLDRMLITLNELINKSAVEKASKAAQAAAKLASMPASMITKAPANAETATTQKL